MRRILSLLIARFQIETQTNTQLCVVNDSEREIVAEFMAAR